MNLNNDTFRDIQLKIKEALRPSLEKYNGLAPRQRSQYLLLGVIMGLFFIQIVFISPISLKAKELKGKSAALLTATTQNREAAQTILSQVQQSIANPRSSEAKRLMKQIEDLNSGLTVYYNDTVTASEMAEVLREILAQDKSLTLVSMSSLPMQEVLNDDPQFAEFTKLERRPKLFKRGVQIVFRGNYESTFSYLKRLEGYKKEMYWDDFIYVVQEHPIAEVTMTVYTLTHEENWIGN